jgi:hypothetical protein
VRLRAGAVTAERPVVVREDPRVTLTTLQRTQWFAAIDSVASVYRKAFEVSAAAGKGSDAELKRTARELVDRLGSLYGSVMRGGLPPTADQRAQMAYFPTVLQTLTARVAR